MQTYPKTENFQRNYASVSGKRRTAGKTSKLALDITISEESSTEWTGDVWSTSLDPIPTDGKTEQVSLVQNQNYFMTSTASICRWKRVAETCAVTSSMTIPSWRMRKRISDVQTWHNILCQEDTKVVVKVFIKNCALSHQTH